MRFLQRLFGSNSTSKTVPQKHPGDKEVMIGVTSLIKDRLPEGTEVLTESRIPEFCIVGNLIFEKKYHEAIELGKKLLEQTPHSAGIHVNLMDAYFKIRNEDPHSFDKCLEHARLAMLYGHNTGYVQERLAISLEKQGKIYQAMQICDIVLQDNFQFSSHGCGRKEEFLKRKEKLQNKLNKSLDSEKDALFTHDEIAQLLQRSQP